MSVVGVTGVCQWWEWQVCVSGGSDRCVSVVGVTGVCQWWE